MKKSVITMECLMTIDEEQDIEFGFTNYDSTIKTADDVEVQNIRAGPLHDHLKESALQSVEQSNSSFDSEDDRGFSQLADAYSKRTMPPATDVGSDDTMKGDEKGKIISGWKEDNGDSAQRHKSISVLSQEDRPHPHLQHNRHQRTKEMDSVEEQSCPGQSISTTTKIGAFVVFIVVILVVSITIVVLRANAQNGDYVDASNYSGTDLITERLKEILSDAEMPSSLNQEDSPQYKARMWLLNDDAQLRETSNTRHRLNQRFVLATLYISANGEKWKWNDSDNKEDNANVTTFSSSRSNRSIELTNQQTFVADSISFLNPHTHECTWMGIACTNSDDGGTTDIIFSINLSGRNLDGKLPKEIGLLSDLQHLRLSENKLTGAMPETIEDISNLEYIDVSQNQMSGTVPSGLWSLSSLRYVYLHDNALGGQIDSYQFRRHYQHSEILHDVWLHQNQLTGPIPSWFGELEQLESLILFGNLLTGNMHKSMILSSSNTGLSRLLYLDVSSNLLWGSIPSGDNHGLRSLSHLDISSNLIQGTIPSNLFNTEQLYFPSLQHVYLDNNMLSGPLPRGNDYSNIQNLWLNSNNLSGTVPNQFGSQWYRLRELLLHDNRFTGIITDCTAITRRNRTTGASISTARFVPQFWPEIERLEADCLSPSVQCPCCTECYPS